MRKMEEIRLRLPFVMNMGGNTWGSRITINGHEGSVVFTFETEGWEHVSFAPFNKKRMPSWSDMVALKRIFWEDEEAVIQIIPKDSEYVNIVDNCLHLWRNTSVALP